jgi:predicted MPP superfamily phosphohydrolase
VIRVAAVGDVHFGLDSRGTLRPAFLDLPRCADLLLLAGDLTRRGTDEEADVLLDELDGVDVPRIAVLGNHDYESDRAAAIAERMTQAGMHVLEGSSHVVEVDGVTVGIAGTPRASVAASRARTRPHSASRR